MTLLDTKKLNKLWAKSTDLNNPLRERHMFDLAFFLWSNKQFDEAIAVTGSLLDLMEERVGSSIWIDAMHLQSMALHDAKRDDEAIESELLALSYGETLEPASDRAFMHWHLADCYRTTEQPALQEEEYLKAIDAFNESNNLWFLGQAYIDLANLHYMNRRYAQSKQYFLLAVPVLQATMRTDRLPWVKYRLAGGERHSGNPQSALTYAEEALSLSRFANENIVSREHMVEIGLIHVDLGNFESAISIFDSLIEDNDVTDKHWTAAKSIYYRARTYAQLGNLKEAAEGYAQAIPLLNLMNLDAMSINAQLALIHMAFN